MRFVWIILGLSLFMVGCTEKFKADFAAGFDVSNRATSFVELVAELPDTEEYMLKELVAELPDVDQYKLIGEQFADIGFTYKTISLKALGIPIIKSIPIISDLSLFNYKKRLVLFIDVNKSKNNILMKLSGPLYLPWDVDKETLDEIAVSAGITLKKKLTLPFWKEWGGRIVLTLIILIFLIYKGILPIPNFLRKVKANTEEKVSNNNTAGTWSPLHSPSSSNPEKVFNYKPTDKKLNNPKENEKEIINDPEGYIAKMDKYFADDKDMQIFMRDVIRNFVKEGKENNIGLEDYIKLKSEEYAKRDFDRNNSNDSARAQLKNAQDILKSKKKKKKTAIIVFVIIIILIVIIGMRSPSKKDNSPVDLSNATITGDINFRTEASGESEIIKTIYKDTAVIITGDAVNGWVPIEHEGVKGWVGGAYIKKN